MHPKPSIIAGCVRMNMKLCLFSTDNKSIQVVGGSTVEWCVLVDPKGKKDFTKRCRNASYVAKTHLEGWFGATCHSGWNSRRIMQLRMCIAMFNIAI